MKNVKLLFIAGVLSLAAISGYAADQSVKGACPTTSVRANECSRFDKLCNKVDNLIDSSSFTKLKARLDQLSALTKEVGASCCNTRKMEKFIATTKKMISERKDGKFTQKDKNLLKAKLQKARTPIVQELSK